MSIGSCGEALAGQSMGPGASPPGLKLGSATYKKFDLRPAPPNEGNSPCLSELLGELRELYEAFPGHQGVSCNHFYAHPSDCE